MSTNEAQRRNLQKLEDILNLIQEGISKDDFVNAFEEVINYVKKIEVKILAELESLRAEYEKVIKTTKDEVATLDIKALRKQAIDFLTPRVDRITKEHNDAMGTLKTAIAGIRDGKDGINGKDGRDGKDGKSGKDADIQPLWDELQNRLEEFDKKIKEIPERPTTTFFGPGKTKIATLDLSSKLNGTLKKFHIGTHFGIVSCDSSSAPFGAWRPDIDYKEVGEYIEFTSEVDAETMLASGQSLIVRFLW